MFLDVTDRIRSLICSTAAQDDRCLTKESSIGRTDSDTCAETSKITMIKSQYLKRDTPCSYISLHVSKCNPRARNPSCQQSNSKIDLTTSLANAYIEKLWHTCLVQIHCIYSGSLGRRHVDPSDMPIHYIDNRTIASPPLLGSSHNFID